MPFGNIGIGGLVLILIIALIIFGPSKLPELGRAFGRTLSEFKSATRGLVGGGTDEGHVRDAEVPGEKSDAGRKSPAAADAKGAAAETAAAVESIGEPDAVAAGAAAAEHPTAVRGGTR